MHDSHGSHGSNDRDPRSAFAKLWLDAADGRLGTAIAATIGEQRLVAALADADVAVLLRVFNADDADAAITAANKAGFSGRWIFVSSLAERRYERWRLPEPEDWSAEPWPQDDYGRAKREARQRLEARAKGPVLTLLLPAIVFADDPNSPWRVHLEQFDRLGHALIAGSGEQLSGAMSPLGIASIIAALARSRAFEQRALQVGPPRPIAVKELVMAFLDGAGHPPKWQPHPDQNFRGPLSAADEVCATGALDDALHDALEMSPGTMPSTTKCHDMREVCRRLGALVASTRP